jgi:preprotein translocase subunit SecG
MGLIGIILLVLMVISAVLLVLVILVQDDQGEGIGGIFGGGSNTAFGSRSGNVLTRFTAVVAAIFLFTVFGMAWLARTPAAGNVLTKARQEALNSTTQQSWWVQAPATGTGTPGSNAPVSGANPFSPGAAPVSGPAPAPAPAAPTGGQ